MNSRIKISVRGVVQGVGFRPFVYSLAKSLNLKGFVMNSSKGVTIEIEGNDSSLFVERLKNEAPPLSKIMNLDVSPLPYHGYKDFQIVESEDEGSFTLISPDVSVCKDCFKELLSDNDRRYLYPFINCTNCGPRYTITRSVPYDRPNTTMSVFQMCAECNEEYHNPGDRRFHAQPNACPVCGPHVKLIVKNKKNPPSPPFSKGGMGGLLDETPKVDKKENPIKETIRLLKEGYIVAIKGLGGFHLACDASNERAVNMLRLRKRKSNKPFALMAPDVKTVRKFCNVSSEEENLLLSIKRPMVLLTKKGNLFHEDGPEGLGCGADIKNIFTLTKGSFAIPSQHIGDMENYETLQFFEESLRNLKDVYRVHPVALAYDLHPMYLSTQWALRQEDIQKIGIQHHYAHVASVMAEKGIKEKVLGVSFDGTGYGTDGNLWGAEFLTADIEGFTRVGHFKYIPLPGGEVAVKEPWRIAVSLIKDVVGDETIPYLQSIGFIEKYGDKKISDILKIIDNRQFSPLSSGAGRLFDAISALMGVCDKNTFEGEAAIALEAITRPGIVDDYPVDIQLRNPLEVDFSQTVLKIIGDLAKGESKGIISSKFHNTLVNVIVRVIKRLSQAYSINDVVLCGGVFQNMYLLERAMSSLVSTGMKVHIHDKVPTNDAGISLGQAYIIRERIKKAA